MGEGQTLFQKSDQTNTPQFKKWFGGSKVVDANGKPLVVYHGTSAHFDIFDRKLISENTLDYGINGHGFYFTSDPEEADLYANQGESWKSGANIKPVFLKMSNPLDLDFSSHSPAQPKKYYNITTVMKRNSVPTRCGMYPHYWNLPSVPIVFSRFLIVKIPPRRKIIF